MIHSHLPPCTEYGLYQTSSHSCYPVQAGGKKSKMIQGVPINMVFVIGSALSARVLIINCIVLYNVHLSTAGTYSIKIFLFTLKLGIYQLRLLSLN